MFSITNVFIIALISSTCSFALSYPSVFLDMITTFYTDMWFAFSINQWKILLPIIIVTLLGPWWLYWIFRSTTYVYDGRKLKAQSLGVTSQDKTVATATDESNQSTANVGKSKETKTAEQKQAAPNLNEDVVLKKGVITEPYSTSMYVGQYTFASTNVLGDTIFYIEPTQLFTNNNFKRLFIDKRFAKFDIRFTVNVTGNPMATGILAMANLPYNTVLPSSIGSQDVSTNYNWNNLYDRVISSNHVLADMSIDGVYKMDMPYTYFSKYLSTFDYTSATSWATLACVVISPYLPATGQTTSINLEVYANLINLEFMAENAPYNTQSLLSIGETTTIVNELSHVNNAALPMNVTGDSLSATIPGSAMLDNPPDTRNAETSVFRMAYQKLASFWNAVDVWKTSSTPMEVAEFLPKLKEELRVDVDEMSLDFFKGRWYSPSNINAVYPITTSTSTGTRLASFPICPLPLNGPFLTNFTASANCDFTQWILSFFRWWRGSIRFRIVIASNAFKRGKILVCINYGGTATSLPATIGTGTIDPRSLPHIIIDLSNKDRFVDIDIPYKSVYEYLRIPNITNNSTLLFNETSLGTLGIYLISPLQVNNGTATTINLNVFQCWGPDFEVFAPQQIPGCGYTYQARLDAPGPKTDTTIDNMMVPVTSLQQLLRTRPSYVGTYYVEQPTSDSGLPAPPLIVPINPTFQSSCPLWSGICSAYSGMRGGYRLNLRFSNITTGTTLRVAYFESLVPQLGDGSFVSTAGGPNFDLTNLSTLFNTAISGGQMTNIPTVLQPLQGISPVNINNITPSTPGAVRIYGIPLIQDIVVDPYSQPEVIIEIPDPAPMYRSQSTIRVPTNYTYGTTGSSYNPYKDRTIGWVAIIPVDCNPATDESGHEQHMLYSCQMTMTAADDFRAFWYNGGPTSITPYSVGATGTTSTYYYFNPAGK